MMLAAAACGTDEPDTDTPVDAVGTAGAGGQEDPIPRPAATAQPLEFVRPESISYGPGDQQFGDLYVPGTTTPVPVVVLIHGGFWRTPYDLTLMDPLADDLVDRGYAVWNIEYRRLGDEGGGWPGTFDDVAAAIDELADLAASQPLDLDRVVFVGHSAGGHLAMWAGGRAALPPDAPGANPAIVPILAIGQGPVVDMRLAGEYGDDGGVADELLGGTAAEVPERYDWATPSAAGGVPLVAVVGTFDTIVPPELSTDPAQPDAIEVITIEGDDHFDLIDPASASWAAVVERISSAVGR